MDKFIFEITPEMIKVAKSYIPLSEKVAIAKAVAEACIEPLETSVLSVQADNTLALPKQYEENIYLKKLYLAQYFLSEYLNIQLPENFTGADYDKFFASHPMNQLERMKGSTELKNKVFDILADFKELKKIVDIEIYNAKAARNDGLERLLAGITVVSTPENVEALVKELKQATDNLATARETATDKRKEVAEIQKKAAKVKQAAKQIEGKKE